MLLYRANARSFGNWDPKTKNTHTVKREVTHDDFVGHFDGTMGIGCVPLRDDDSCYWGAIDIDNHGRSDDTDIVGVEAAVSALGYPLVATRSKSGGVHLYLFLNEPAPAELVRRVLRTWADKLKIPGTDCLFPKHDKMNKDADTGVKGLSNWINFPYFNVNNKTDRYAVVNGKPVEFQMFLEYAEGKRQSPSDLQKWSNFDHSEAPPCLQAKFAQGFAPGERNTGIYQITVYARKKERDTDTAAEVAHELSEQYMPDIKYGERVKTIKSALTKNYNFKCDDFKDVCDREACRKRKYGVSETQYKDMKGRESMPRFYEAIMWTGLDTPKWSVKAELGEGVEYEIKYLDTDEIRKIDLFRRRMIELTPIFLPPIKQGEWEAIIGPVMSSKIAMPMPEDTTELGILKGRLHEFLSKANFKADVNDPQTRGALMRGLPVIYILNGVEVLLFRAQDFDKYLKDTKSDTVKKNMWFKMVDNIGASSERIRVGNQVMSVWAVASAAYHPDALPVHDFKPEY